MNRVQQHLKKIEIFCNMKVFNVTFDQFNVYLLNKSINFVLKNNPTNPKF